MYKHEYNKWSRPGPSWGVHTLDSPYSLLALNYIKINEKLSF